MPDSGSRPESPNNETRLEHLDRELGETSNRPVLHFKQAANENLRDYLNMMNIFEDELNVGIAPQLLIIIAYWLLDKVNFII